MPRSTTRRGLLQRVALALTLAVAPLATAPAAAAVSPAAGPPARGLTADNLLLIVNKNEPAGDRLAAFYAAQRKVPAGRVLALDLPKGDEVPFDQFTGTVVPAVRAFLKANNLEDRVTCLVTFYGVPLRVGPRANTPAEAAEYRAVDGQIKDLTEKARQAVASAEDVARQAKPDFAPPAVAAAGPDELPGLPPRADAAINAALAALPADDDATRRAQRASRLMAAVETLYGPLEAQERMTLPAYQRVLARPVPPEDVAARQSRTRAVVAEVQSLGPRAADDPAARLRLRELFAADLGALRTLQVLLEQRAGLETRETEAAVDSELACLWWPDARVRHRWHENPLNHRARFAASAGPPAGPTSRPVRPAAPRTVMTMRLDGPTEPLVRDLIATSVRVEAEGLKGVVAIDARGKPPSEPYGRFDALLRGAAEQFRFRTKLTVKVDDAEPVFAPGAVADVALYCGWYSLRSYVPGMAFSPGAVGYHVASSEMVSLRNPGERGWAANLLKAGVVGTLGPVAEPYLHAFPPPDEFFPLLATGKLTLAEVYWLTNPLVGWMNACVGDPLYNPYAKAPPLKDTDVSHRLRAIFAEGGAGEPEASSRSATAPAR